VDNVTLIRVVAGILAVVVAIILVYRVKRNTSGQKSHSDF
jgi:hypothetical protein